MVTAQQFMKYMEDRRVKHGFRDSWEALAVAHNWKQVFHEDLPENYVHSRDYCKLEKAMEGGLN